MKNKNPHQDDRGYRVKTNKRINKNPMEIIY